MTKKSVSEPKYLTSRIKYYINNITLIRIILVSVISITIRQ